MKTRGRRTGRAGCPQPAVIRCVPPAARWGHRALPGQAARSVLDCGGPPPLSHPTASPAHRQSARGLAQSKTCRWRLALLCLLPFGLSLCAQAQYSIDWSTLDGGGGTSTGGPYTVSGTIGQPDAGALSGGTFTLQGGFWPGIVVMSTGEAPALFIHVSGNSVIVSWSPATAGFTLEEADDLARADWVPAPAGNPVPIPMAGPARFYRLKKP
jgi:hypothetical protein